MAQSKDIKPVIIGIAAVEHDGRFLVGVREANQALPGLHEFPGGKCEAGETPAECAVRECREETGLSVMAIEELYRTVHRYDHATVELHFWLCRPVGEVAEPNRGFLWIPRADLASLSFPEANAPVIAMLQS